MNSNIENIPNQSSTTTTTTSTSTPSKQPKQSQFHSHTKSSTIKLTRPSLSTITSSISRNKSSPIINPSSNHQPTTTTTSNLSFSVGDRVRANNQMVGKCAFIGTIDQKIGLWVGIDLSYPLHDPGQPPWYGKGKNSGSVNGVSYFTCESNCGIFFPISKVSAYPFPPSQSSTTQSQQQQQQQRIIFPPRPHSPTKPPTINTTPTEPDPSNKSSSPNRRLSRSLKASLPNPSSNHLSTPKPRPRISLHHNARKSIGNLFNKDRPNSTAILPSTTTPTHTTPTTTTTSSTSSRILRNFSASISKNSNPIPNVPDLLSSPIQSNRHIRASLPDTPPSNLHVLDPEKPATEPILLISDEVSKPQASTTTTDRLIEEMKLDQQPECINEEEDQTRSDEAFKEIEARLKEVEEELKTAKEERNAAEEGLRLAKERSSVYENECYKASEVEKEYKKTIEEKCKVIETMNLHETETHSEIQELKAKIEEEKKTWTEEREELVEQLGSLRLAGQSLCSVYEGKMAEIEERRVEAVERYERLMKEGQEGKEEEERYKLRVEERRIERGEGHQSIAAIEIDNERLKADLKYTKDRLGTLQDQVYELKQELESESEQKERIEEELRVTVERHKTIIRKMKEENSIKVSEKESLELKLGQVEMRLKECVETMEKDRAELEGLRDELMVSQPRSNSNTKLVIPTNTDDDDFSKKIRFEGTTRDQDQDDEDDRRRTVIDRGELEYNQTVHDQADHPPRSKEVEELTHTKAQLESELTTANRRIEELLEQIDKSQETPKLERMSSNEQMKGISSDEEKLTMMKKYQGLLSIKQEENLGLIHRLDSLEKHVSSLTSHPQSHHYHHHHPESTKARPKVWMKRGGREDCEGSFGSSVGSALPHWVTDQRSNAGSSSGCSIVKGRTGHAHSSPTMMTKEMQEILGLKVLLNQSDEDRVKVEIENRELKSEIEELKNTNRMLEGAIENPVKMIKDYDKTVRLEKEIGRLKREMEVLNRKHIQQVDALNQEVVELESIIELKVLKEAELEADLQQYQN